MTNAETRSTPTIDSEQRNSWRWATVLAVHPFLTAGALLNTLLFGLAAAAARAEYLPEFVPLLPGALALLCLGVVHLYTPIYVTGLIMDLRAARKDDTEWSSPRWVLLAGGLQTVYFVGPVVQAYGVDTFDELVFGSIEYVLLVLASIVTVRYLYLTGDDACRAPSLVSLCVRAWSKISTR